MKWALAVALLVPTIASAQIPEQPADQSGSLPPLQQQWERQGQAPVPSLNAPLPPTQSDRVLSGQGASDQDLTGQGQVDQAEGSQGQADQRLPGQADQGQVGQSQAPANQGLATFSRPNVWMPATGAKIQALDKVDARAKDFSLKIGQSATFGSLTITVKACVVRPSDQPADAAAFLDVTDSHPDSGNFNGWMLRNEPSVSMMQNPLYDLRVDGCT